MARKFIFSPQKVKFYIYLCQRQNTDWLMIYLIILLAFIIWLYNYVRFCRDYKYFQVMVNYLNDKIKHSQDADAYTSLLSLSSALMKIQHYDDAYNILHLVLLKYPNTPDKDKILMNMDFCKNPIPCVHKLKNYNHSYWHKFVLTRLGKKRYYFITEQDLLKTNSILRNM